MALGKSHSHMPIALPAEFDSHDLRVAVGVAAVVIVMLKHLQPVLVRYLFLLVSNF